MRKAALGAFKSQQAPDASLPEHSRLSYRPYGSESPLNSPVAGNLGARPAFPGTSTPTSIEDTSQRPGRSDYIVDQIEGPEEQEKEAQQSSYLVDEDPTHSNIDQGQLLQHEGRGGGHRSPPGTAASSTTTTTAGHPASPLTSPDERSPKARYYPSTTVKPSKADPKKKKRFWNNWGESFGLGLSSSSSASNAVSNSSNTRPSPQFASPQISPAPHPKVLTKKRPNAPRNHSSNKQFPPKAQEEPVQHAPDFAAKTRQRHSVIGLPFQSQLREGSASSRDDLSRSKFSRDPSFNTASSQAQGEVGSQRPPAWDRLGRVPHQRTASSDESYAIHSAGTSAQKSRLEPGYPEQHYSNSRPPSRQSIEPPSPSETSYTLSHQRTTSSQNSSITNTKSFMGSQNNQQQISLRSAEGQSNPSTREGV